MGCFNRVIPIDTVTIKWLKTRAKSYNNNGIVGISSNVDNNGEHPRINSERIKKLCNERLTSDSNAYYAKTISINLGTIRPHVAGPDNVKTISSIFEIQQQNIEINKAYLVSCVNSRVSDIAEAAKVMKSNKVAKGVKFYIAAASSEVQAESMQNGDWQILLEAGAIEIPPGCGPCIGLGVGLLEEGEVGVSATNRNFKGRMGSRDAQAFLASPAVVAASAIAGKITGPVEFDSVLLGGSIKISNNPVDTINNTKLLNRFPEKMSGNVVLCPQDNINTDGIYPANILMLMTSHLNNKPKW